ncbi:Cilia- and flagella-associated protein 206 [Dissostichus eleginoides]|uniref:Cilia- and flagella-associated protein 206 n=1 Tax=Dissostichus eleginoides TaxID=100907 RepID=A0AAD9C2F0_DISEL|nr:Cilia- and flagella-associated protein 206 [Dissostichus eleginoides]
MKYRAGFWSVAFVWMGVLMQGLDAGRAPKKHSAVSCKPKELTVLTKTLVVASLKLFDKDNGEPPGPGPLDSLSSRWSRTLRPGVKGPVQPPLHGSRPEESPGGPEGRPQPE